MGYTKWDNPMKIRLTIDDKKFLRDYTKTVAAHYPLKEYICRFKLDGDTAILDRTSCALEKETNLYVPFEVEENDIGSIHLHPYQGDKAGIQLTRHAAYPEPHDIADDAEKKLVFGCVYTNYPKAEFIGCTITPKMTEDEIISEKKRFDDHFSMIYGSQSFSKYISNFMKYHNVKKFKFSKKLKDEQKDI
jgi:hypothetical protein